MYATRVVAGLVSEPPASHSALGLFDTPSESPRDDDRRRQEYQ
jgi:hypothetical protein